MTVRRLIFLSTAVMLIVLSTLVSYVWWGFQQASESIDDENSVAVPALVSMLQIRFDVVQIQQFLTDVSATGETGGFTEAKAAYDNAFKNLDKLASLKPNIAKDIPGIKESMTKFHTLGIEMANAYIKLGRDEGNLLMKRPNDGFDDLALQLTQQLGAIEKIVRENTLKSAQNAESRTLSAQKISLVFGLIVALLMVASGFIVYQRLSRILGGEPGYAAQVARSIALGDLSQEVVIPAGNEKSLLGSIRDMQDGLRTIIRGIGDSTTELMASAHELSQAAGKVSNAAEAQSDKASAMAASIEEMSVSITQITDSAGGVHRSAVSARGLSDAGSTSLSSAISEMDSISDAVMHSAESVKTLGEHSEKISEIVNVIREIADQTNLLALNAAIEAARAGEQGRGFAVVADEVRKLAERTAKATTEIKATVDAVRQGTCDAVAEMSTGSSRVLAGAVQIRQVGETMARIEGGVGEVLAATDEISGSLREQDVANQEIARGVEGVAQMSEETSVIVRTVADSANRLEALASTMNQSVRKFRI
jgi:methyl-accepting chemotaxis protein